MHLSTARTAAGGFDLQRPYIAAHVAAQIDFGGPKRAVHGGVWGDYSITFRFDVAKDFSVDMDASVTEEIPLYFRAGGDDGGRAVAAMWPVSAMKDSHGTFFTFLNMSV